PSLHVGFVRAGGCDTSTRGLACGLDAAAQFVRWEWCQTVTNTTGALTDAFACLGDFGAANCGPAQPLARALDALTSPPRPGWEGFLRPEAYLMIVVIAATDDEASGVPGDPDAVVALANRAKGLKPDPSQLLVSLIGPGD